MTFDDAHLPAAPEDAQKLIQNFLRRLKRKYTRLGLDAKYIYVLEYGCKHNRLHAHLVLTGGITRADLEQLWGLGSVSLDALRFDFDGLALLAKYLIKGGESDVRPTWKRWSGSRNLEQPTVTQRDGQLSHRKMASLCQDGGYYTLGGRNTVEVEGKFTPGEAFFRKLQQIVSDYDFAQHNGQYYTVGGLPPGFGMKLEIRYASEETIGASNNGFSRSGGGSSRSSGGSF